MLTAAAEHILKTLSFTPAAGAGHGAASYDRDTALALYRRVFPLLFDEVRSRRVLEHGCGTGEQAVAWGESGAAESVGVDLNQRWLSSARALAAHRSLANVRFTDTLRGESGFDVVISRNAMEHYPDPAAALAEMVSVLRPGGLLFLTFGPLWYAPYGAHMHFWTKVPWVHLLFPERAVMAVRNRIVAHDGSPSRYEDVEGGLNRMSVAKMRRLVKALGLRVEHESIEYAWGCRPLGRIPLAGELLANHMTLALRRT